MKTFDNSTKSRNIVTTEGHKGKGTGVFKCQFKSAKSRPVGCQQRQPLLIQGNRQKLLVRACLSFVGYKRNSSCQRIKQGRTIAASGLNSKCSFTRQRIRAARRENRCDKITTSRRAKAQAFPVIDCDSKLNRRHKQIVFFESMIMLQCRQADKVVLSADRSQDVS